MTRIGTALLTTTALALGLAQGASAADLAPYRGAPPSQGFSWTGCYIGTQSGLATGHTKWRDVLPIGTIDATRTGQTANTDMSGSIFGGQIGCDYQFGSNWVIGIDGSFAGSNLAGTNIDQFNSTWALRAK